MSVTLPSSPLRVALAGAGTVGSVIAASLQARGHRVTSVWSRTASSALAASRRLGCDGAGSAADVGREADVVLIGAVDDALAEVAAAVAPSLRAGSIVVHFAGSHGTEVLRTVTDAGARPAALHPVQALPNFDAGMARLPGSAWGVTCPAELTAWSATLIRDDLRGQPVTVAEADRPLWHAASVMTSNGIAALMGSGMAVLDALGVDDPGAVLGPLAAGTVANVRTIQSPGDAFTGPVVRGDLATVARHVASLRERAPELLDAYRTAVEVVISGARRRHRIDDSTAAEARALLEPA